MTIEIVGPRIVYFEDKDGEYKEIHITIKLGGRNEIHFDNEPSMVEHLGYVEITSALFHRKMKALGSDDIQVIYWLIKFADSWLQKYCEDFGLKLFKNIPGDITSEMGVFS